MFSVKNYLLAPSRACFLVRTTRLLLLCMLLLGVVACEEEEEDNPPPEIPEQTYAFQAQINGETWRAQTSYAIFDTIFDVLTVYGSRPSNEGLQSVRFQYDGDLRIGSYTLGQDPIEGFYQPSPNEEIPLQSGTLTIDSIRNEAIYGSFSGSADGVEILEGELNAVTLRREQTAFNDTVDALMSINMGFGSFQSETPVAVRAQTNQLEIFASGVIDQTVFSNVTLVLAIPEGDTGVYPVELTPGTGGRFFDALNGDFVFTQGEITITRNDAERVAGSFSGRFDQTTGGIFYQLSGSFSNVPIVVVEE